MLGIIISWVSDFQGPGLKVKVTGYFRKTLLTLYCLYLSMDFNVRSRKCGYDNISSKFDFQGIELKVTVAGANIYQWILILRLTNVWW